VYERGREYMLRWEDAPYGLVVAIYESGARIGTYYPESKQLHLVFSGHLRDLAKLIQELRDFLGGGKRGGSTD